MRVEPTRELTQNHDIDAWWGPREALEDYEAERGHKEYKAGGYHEVGAEAGKPLKSGGYHNKGWRESCF